MKSVSIFCVLIFLMSEADNFVFDNTNTLWDHKVVSEQKVLLRKLKNVQPDDPKDDTKSVTWSEMLADLLVNKIKIFSLKSSEKEQAISYDIAKEPTDNFLTRLFSNVLLLYKDIVFDKFKANDNTRTSGNEEFQDPKRDVETLKPESYNGELCESCGDEDLTKHGRTDVSDVCPEGKVKDDSGNCGEPKPSKLILRIPNQCPIGYKADRLGYCRESF